MMGIARPHSAILAKSLFVAILLFSVTCQLINAEQIERCDSEMKSKGKNCVEESRESIAVHFYGKSFQWSMDVKESLTRTGFYFDWQTPAKPIGKQCPPVKSIRLWALDSRSGIKLRLCRLRFGLTINNTDNTITSFGNFPPCPHAYETKAPGLDDGKARITLQLETDSPRQPHCQNQLVFDRPIFELAPDQAQPTPPVDCEPGENCIQSYGERSINVSFYGGEFSFRIDVPVEKRNSSSPLQFLWAVRPKCAPQKCELMSLDVKEWDTLKAPPSDVTDKLDIDGRRDKAQKAEARVIKYNCWKAVVPDVNVHRASIDFELRSEKMFDCPTYLLFPRLNGTDYDYRFPGDDGIGVNCINPNMHDSIVVKFYGGQLDKVLELPAEAKSNGFNFTWKKPLSFLGESNCWDQSIQLIPKDASGKPIHGCMVGVQTELPELAKDGDEEEKRMYAQKCPAAIFDGGTPGRAHINLRLESKGPMRFDCPNQFIFAHDDGFSVPEPQTAPFCKN